MSASAANVLVDRFESDLDEWVACALRAPIGSFSDFLERLPGVDPATALRVLQRWHADGGLGAAAQHLSDVAHSSQASRGEVSDIPIPHPLEFDWRFTTDTVDRFLASVQASTASGSTVVYLGVPMVFVAACRVIGDRRHILVDASHRRFSTGGTAEVVVSNLLTDEPPPLHADLVVMDPPWYPAETANFLRAASLMLRPGGHVYLSHAPVGTRPTVRDETDELREWIRLGGMVVEDERPLSLRYQTPPFERSAARAAGIPTLPVAWRRGDLMVARRERVPCRLARRGQTREDWRMAEIDQVPLAVRRTGAESSVASGSLLKPIVPGEVLPSVSRRDPRRAGIVLWTSMNRGFRSSAPRVVDQLVGLLEQGCADSSRLSSLAGESGVRQESVLETANLLKDVVRCERKEHGLD